VRDSIRIAWFVWIGLAIMICLSFSDRAHGQQVADPTEPEQGSFTLLSGEGAYKDGGGLQLYVSQITPLKLGATVVDEGGQGMSCSLRPFVFQDENKEQRLLGCVEGVLGKDDNGDSDNGDLVLES
jgi:hypothetical protein